MRFWLKIKSILRINPQSLDYIISRFLLVFFLFVKNSRPSGFCLMSLLYSMKNIRCPLHIVYGHPRILHTVLGWISISVVCKIVHISETQPSTSKQKAGSDFRTQGERRNALYVGDARLLRARINAECSPWVGGTWYRGQLPEPTRHIHKSETLCSSSINSQFQNAHKLKAQQKAQQQQHE